MNSRRLSQQEKNDIAAADTKIHLSKAAEQTADSTTALQRRNEFLVRQCELTLGNKIPNGELYIKAENNRWYCTVIVEPVKNQHYEIEVVVCTLTFNTLSTKLQKVAQLNNPPTSTIKKIDIEAIAGVSPCIHDD